MGMTAALQPAVDLLAPVDLVHVARRGGLTPHLLLGANPGEVPDALLGSDQLVDPGAAGWAGSVLRRRKSIRHRGTSHWRANLSVVPALTAIGPG